MANRCAQGEENLADEVGDVKYSREERLGIIVEVAKDTGFLVCSELFEMLSLSLTESDVAELIDTYNITVTYEPVEEVPAKVNLTKDQEYAMVAGIQLGNRSDFCMKQIIKHYHRQQVSMIINNIPVCERSYIDEITDEMMWEMTYRYFDLRKNTRLVTFLNVSTPMKVLREYMYGDYVNGMKLPEKRHILITKVKRYFAENGIDVEKCSNKELKKCVEELTAKGVSITMRDLTAVVSDMVTKTVPLSTEAYADVLDTVDAGAITQSSVSVTNTVSAESMYIEAEKYTILSNIMDKELSSIEKYIIYRYHGFISEEKITRKELAEYMGVELKQLMAIERGALKKLRERIMADAPELADFSYT